MAEDSFSIGARCKGQTVEETEGIIYGIIPLKVLFYLATKGAMPAGLKRRQVELNGSLAKKVIFYGNERRKGMHEKKDFGRRG